MTKVVNEGDAGYEDRLVADYAGQKIDVKNFILLTFDRDGNVHDSRGYMNVDPMDVMKALVMITEISKQYRDLLTKGEKEEFLYWSANFLKESHAARKEGDCPGKRG